MADRHTLEELNNCSREELITIVLMMQGQLDTLNENIERLIEQVRIANSYRFGKHTETLDSIDGQLSFFDEAENCCNLSVPEPAFYCGVQGLLYNRSPDKIVARATSIGYNTKYSGLHKN